MWRHGRQLLQKSPIKPCARVCFAARCNVFMPCNVFNGILILKAFAECGESGVLNRFKETALNAFQLNPNRVVVAIAAPTVV